MILGDFLAAVIDGNGLAFVVNHDAEVVGARVVPCRRVGSFFGVGSTTLEGEGVFQCFHMVQMGRKVSHRLRLQEGDSRDVRQPHSKCVCHLLSFIKELATSSAPWPTRSLWLRLMRNVLYNDFTF